MSTELKKVSPSVFEVEYEVKGDELKQASEKALNKLVSKVSIKGFRKGKAPLNLAKERISPVELANETINQSLNVAYTNILKEHKIEPALRPEVDVKSYKEDSIVLKFIITAQPTCEIGEYKNIKIDLEKVKVSKEEVEKAVEQTLKDSSELTLKETAAEMGDEVTFDFKGYIDGKEFDGGSANNYTLVLGSNQFVPGFEDQLVGVLPETKKDVIVTFPEQYVKDLAGKEAKFVCIIHEIKTKVSPELNDEFVKSLSIEGVETVEQFKDYKKKSLLANKEKDAKNKQFVDLLNTIIAGSKFEISDNFINAQAEAEKQQMKAQIEQNGITFEQYKEITGLTEEALSEQAKENALVRLKEALVYNAIARKENLLITKDEVEAYYVEMSKRYAMPLENIKKVLGQNENGLVQSLFQNKVENFILKNNLENSDAPKAKEVKEEKAEKPAKKTTSKKATKKAE